MRKNGSVPIDDTEMHYVAFGSGDKRLVVLPGLSDGLATVKGKALLLAAPYKRFLNDYTVYMFSRKNAMPEGYSIRDMAADQVQAMRALGMEQADVLGVSQGGMIAQCIAIDFPEVVGRLILTVTASYANEVIQEGVAGWIEMVERGDHTALMVSTAEKMYSQEYLRKNSWTFPLIAKFTKPKSYDRFFKNACAILEFDARDELAKIACPTLIIAGDDDHTVGTDAAGELHEAIAGSEFFVYEGLGHGLYEEAKDFYDRIYEFCSK